MERKNWVYRQSNMRRSQRGAALMYALIAVIVITTLTLATGRLIGHHLALEQNAEGYSRAINIAEAAANWQLNRMSRSNLPDDNSNVPGRLNYEDVNTWNGNSPDPYIGTLPSSELGVPFDGNVKIWVRSAAIGGQWTPPQDFILRAVGQDPQTRITRAIEFNGRGVGLSEPYALFGINELSFDSASTLVGADVGAARLNRGYIGSNRKVAYRVGTAAPVGGQYFFGCRLAPSAVLEPDMTAWSASWDYPTMPNRMYWPTIDQVIAYSYRGRSVADCATANDNNTQIDMLQDDGTFVPLRPGGNFATKLTSAEFNLSPRRTIRLRGNENASNGNLFYFTQIEMRPEDVLILDLRRNYPVQNGPEHTIKILINNNDSSLQNVVTNLAYFDDQVPEQSPGERAPNTQSYYWYNNTANSILYKPTRAFEPNFYVPSDVSQLFRYQIDPTLRGMIYGINTQAADGNSAGDITVYGKTAFPVRVDSLVGNHVRLLGPVRVGLESLGQYIKINAEDTQSPSRYILYYTVNSRRTGEINPNLDPFDVGAPSQSTSFMYDYGR